MEQVDQQATALLNQDKTVPSKPIHAIRLASLSDRSILETEGDVKHFIEALEKYLLAVIDQGDRVRLK